MGGEKGLHALQLCHFACLQNSTVYKKKKLMGNFEMWHNLSTNGVTVEHILSTFWYFHNRKKSEHRSEIFFSFKSKACMHMYSQMTYVL